MPVYNERLYCSTASRERLEDEMVQACHFGRSLMLIMAPTGSGRTIFASHLRAHLSRTMPAAFLSADPRIQLADIEPEILSQLGLHQLAFGHHELHLAIQKAPPGRRVLIVDDAQDLHPSILRKLLQIVRDEYPREDPRLLLLLIGDAMLQTALDEIDWEGLQLDQRQLHQLESWTLDEVQQLIKLTPHPKNKTAPNKAAIKQWWQQFAGLPGPILESLAMHYGQSDRQHEINLDRPEDEQHDELSAEDDVTLTTEARREWQDETMHKKNNWFVTPLILLGALVLALLLLYQREIGQWISGEKPENELLARTELDIAPEAVTSSAADEEIVPASIEVITDDAVAETVPVTTEPQVNGVVANDLIGSGATISTSGTTATGDMVSTDANVGTSVVPSSTMPVATDNKNLKPADSKPIEPVQVATVASNQKQVAESTASVAVKKTSFSKDEQALLKLNAQHFVVQLVGLSDEKSATKFIADNKIKGGKIYRSWRSGKNMYFVVMSGYSTHTAAEKARDQLPESLRKNNPWIKQVKLIQQEMNSRK